MTLIELAHTEKLALPHTQLQTHFELHATLQLPSVDKHARQKRMII